MRKVFLLLVIILQTCFCAFSQCPFPDIDYTNYYEVFSDNFNTYNPSTFKTDPAFTSKWIVPAGGNPCVGNSTCWIEPSQITMPAVGKIRFTETASPYTTICGDPKDHISGWLHTQPAYFVDFGIIEASIKLPPTQTPNSNSAFPTFWVTNYHGDPTNLPVASKVNEIDIMDNDIGHTTESWTKFYTYLPGTSTILQAADLTSLANPPNSCFPTSVNLSNGFHRFSCLWTPSRLIFYIDKHYLKHYDFDGNSGIDEVARTVGQVHSLIIALQTKTTTVPNLQMDVEWVRYLALKCDETDFVIDATHASSITNYPYLPPDYVTNYTSNFNMLKYKNIIINFPSSLTPIKTQQTLATILEAESTTILPDFLADESNTVWGSSTTNNWDATTNNWLAVPIPMNGYFEIRASSCIHHEDAGEGWNNNGGNPNDPESDDDYPEYKPSFIEKDISILSNIDIYPNPTTSSFNIEMPQRGDYSIRVMNMLGSTVYEGKMTDDQKTSIQLDNNLPAGNYTLHISGDGLRHVERITLVK